MSEFFWFGLAFLFWWAILWIYTLHMLCEAYVIVRLQPQRGQRPSAIGFTAKIVKDEEEEDD